MRARIKFGRLIRVSRGEDFDPSGSFQTASNVVQRFRNRDIQDDDDVLITLAALTIAFEDAVLDVVDGKTEITPELNAKVERLRRVVKTKALKPS